MAAPSVEISNIEVLEFYFVVPDKKPGEMIKLQAPDNITLQIVVPEQAVPGDEIHMAKGAGGKWTMKHIVKTGSQAPAAAPSAPSAPARKSDAELARDLESPTAITVQMQTTKGPIFLKVVPSWSPLGVQRFLKLIDDGFFSDIAIYRGIPGFLVQFGIPGDPRKAGKYDKIADDPLCGVPYQDGMVGFAAAGPNTRTSTLCFFLGDAPHLGKSSVETPIGKLLPESMKTLHALHCAGDIPQCGGKGPDPEKLAQFGNNYIRQSFPQCDFVLQSGRITSGLRGGA